MKKIVILSLFYPIFLFSGVFEHLLNKDINYLFEQNFRCRANVCITSEKNIFDNEMMDSSVKVIRTFLDHEQKVYKIEIELSITGLQREAFFDAITRDKNEKLEYKSYETNDKYGNHPIVDIINKQRRENYKMNLSDQYYKTMKSYKK